METQRGTEGVAHCRSAESVWLLGIFLVVSARTAPTFFVLNPHGANCGSAPSGPKNERQVPIVGHTQIHTQNFGYRVCGYESADSACARALLAKKRLVGVVSGRLFRPPQLYLHLLPSSSSEDTLWEVLERMDGSRWWQKMSRQRWLRTQAAAPPAHQETRSVRRPESQRRAQQALLSHGPHEISTPQALNFFALRGQGPPAILYFKKSVLWRRPVGLKSAATRSTTQVQGKGRWKRGKCRRTRCGRWAAGWCWWRSTDRIGSDVRPTSLLRYYKRRY